MDFIETITLSGQRQYILAAIHHANRRIRVLGTTAHPTHPWVIQAIRNLVMDLGETEQAAAVRFLIPDRDTKYPALIKEILNHTGITTVLSGVRMPRMNAIMQRWVKTLRAELLDPVRWPGTRPISGTRSSCTSGTTTSTAPNRALAAAAPLQELPHPLETDRIERLTIR
jgi:transposase InsO family protein